MRTKAIVMAAGSATRLHPLTIAVSKHLLPVWDKPMIYYPLGLLRAAGFTEILLVVSPEHIASYQRLLGDGSSHGLRLNYMRQYEPSGIASGLLLGEDFLEGEGCALALGDNLFHGISTSQILAEARNHPAPRVFTCKHSEPWKYGVAVVDGSNHVVSLEEKPTHPTSNLILTGLYLLTKDAPSMAKSIKPSDRGELEIVDLLRIYADDYELQATSIRGPWADLGTLEDLREANIYIHPTVTPTLTHQ